MFTRNTPTNSCDVLPEAVEALRQGKLVAFPTETVYGLGANALNEGAVAEIYAAKGRPQFNPLIIHYASAQAAQEHVRWSMQAEKLAAQFWPGPLTLVLPRKTVCPVSLLASAGLDTLAVRVPAHALALQLLAQAGVPAAAPSANRSGRISPTRAEHVREELGDKVSVILDGGPCDVGVESTVVDLSGKTPRILRHGAVTQGEIEALLGMQVPVHTPAEDENPAAPGMLKSHYAPSLPVRLNARDLKEGEALLAFGPDAPQGAAHVLNLSEKSDLKEAAANLFAHLRALDATSATGIAVMPVPEVGLGAAINDRLVRAAAR